MATIKKVWDYSASGAEIYTTDGYGGSDSDLDGTERFSDTVNLQASGHEGAQLHLSYDASGTTDDLEVYIYASLDGLSLDNNAGAESEWDFFVEKYAFFQVGMVRSGSTDTFEAKLTYNRWRWDSS
jgi:hypothetical protein